MGEYSFPKNEKLKSRTAINMLFEQGKTEYIYPVKIFWLTQPKDSSSEVKAGFSVPKKKFKRAVDRNLLKRRMREAYRLNKAEIIKQAIEKECSLSLFFIFTANTILDYHQIEKSVVTQLKTLIHKI
ncbi:MAG: ribonuclease P protein component [Bacteroidales bacterium]|nr:ribonuclease P protein component [Bacteroidales bacterium]